MDDRLVIRTPASYATGHWLSIYAEYIYHIHSSNVKNFSKKYYFSKTVNPTVLTESD